MKLSEIAVDPQVHKAASSVVQYQAEGLNLNNITRDIDFLLVNKPELKYSGTMWRFKGAPPDVLHDLEKIKQFGLTHQSKFVSFTTSNDWDFVLSSLVEGMLQHYNGAVYEQHGIGLDVNKTRELLEPGTLTEWDEEMEKLAQPNSSLKLISFFSRYEDEFDFFEVDQYDEFIESI